MKTLLFALASSLALHVCFAAPPPSFHTPSVPEGWMIVRGEVDPGAVRSAKAAVPLELATQGLVDLPMEATFRFRASQGDAVSFALLEEMPDAKTAEGPEAAPARDISADGSDRGHGHGAGRRRGDVDGHSLEPQLQRAEKARRLADVLDGVFPR